MEKTNFLEISINKIKIEDIKSKLIVNEKEIKAMSLSLKRYGQLYSLLVGSTEDGYEVYDGNVRLKGAIKLGWKEIDARIIDIDDDITKQILGIEANLIRTHYSRFEIGIKIKERHELLIILGRRKKVGDNQYKSINDETVAQSFSTNDLAKEAGLKKRTYQLYKKIATDIVPELHPQILNSELKHQTRKLLALSQASPIKQEELLNNMLLGISEEDYKKEQKTNKNNTGSKKKEENHNQDIHSERKIKNFKIGNVRIISDGTIFYRKKKITKIVSSEYPELNEYLVRAINDFFNNEIAFKEVV